MKLVPPIYWHQGMLIQPQHFQLESMSHYSYQVRCNQLKSNEFWGVNTLTINTYDLENGLFSINEGELLFPDGSLIHIPQQCEVTHRAFDAANIPLGSSLKVYLGLKTWASNGKNVTETDIDEDSSPVNTRFFVTKETKLVSDIYGGGKDAGIRQLFYKAKIFWESELENVEGYTFLPLACLENAGSTIVLSQQYVPPTLNVQNSTHLRNIIIDIHHKINSSLENIERFKSVGLSDSSSFAMKTALTCITVAECAWIAQCLKDTPVLHPRVAWIELGVIASKLSCFSRRILDRSTIRYNHCELTACFLGLREQIKNYLSEINLGPKHTIPLEKIDGYFRCSLDRESIDGTLEYWLFIDLEESGADYQVLSSAKLAAESKIATVISRALPGIQLTPCDGTPSGLPQRGNGFYSKLDTASPQWQDACAEKSLVLHWPKDKGLKAVLYTVKRE